MSLLTFTILTMSVIVIMFSANPLPLQQLHPQIVFAQDDESQTGIEKRLGQKNLGSGESTNFNCADNTLQGSPSSLCLSQTAEEEPPESATLSVCKISDLFAGRQFVFTVTGNSPSPEEFSVLAGRIVPNCVDVSIGPGEFTVTETGPFPVPPTDVFITGQCMQDPNNRLRATGEIQAGETQECTFSNSSD